LLRRSFSPLLPWPSEPTRLLAGGIDGLTLLTEMPDGTLREDDVVTQAPSGIRELLDGRDGWVWGTTVDGRVWRADFRRGLRADAPVEIFDAARGLAPVRQRDDAKLFFFGGEIVAASAGWLRRFDGVRGRFEAETRIAEGVLA